MIVGIENANPIPFELCFEVEENPYGIEKAVLFGEPLLHVAFDTDYGRKEIVCGAKEEILNYVMLKGVSGNAEISRFGAYASYESVPDEKFVIALREENGAAQRWVFDLRSCVLSIDDVCGTSVYALKKCDNNV